MKRDTKASWSLLEDKPGLIIITLRNSYTNNFSNSSDTRRLLEQFHTSDNSLIKSCCGESEHTYIVGEQAGAILADNVASF